MGTVKITIDGKEYQVEEGLNLIEAARSVGIHIPHFCYHPKLSIVGSCRMCLVEIEGQRKLQPACNTLVQDGMVVRINTESVKRARRFVLEFFLIHHPLDCPICDKAGECFLQDYTFAYGPGTSRFSYPKKLKKVRSLGEKLNLDMDRCVLCTRCVRFLREITGDEELIVVGRGDDAEISTLPGGEVKSPYAMFTADLCPVGALTIKPFRFSYRVFMHPNRKSVCPFCESLCYVLVGVWRGRFVRVRSADIREEIICDEGRLKTAQVLERRYSTSALLIDGEEKRRLTADDVYRILDSFSEGDAIALSPWLTVEGIRAAVNWAKGKGLKVYALSSQAGEGDSIRRKSIKSPNVQGIQELLKGEPASVELKEAVKSGAHEKVLILHPGPVENVQIPESAPPVMVYAGLDMPDVRGEKTYYVPLATFFETGGTLKSSVRVVQTDPIIEPPQEVWNVEELFRAEVKEAAG